MENGAGKIGDTREMVERVKLLQGANGAAKRMFGGNLMIFDMQTCVFLFTESRVQSPDRQTDRSEVASGGGGGPGGAAARDFRSM
jgi:hypothetical protein